MRLALPALILALAGSLPASADTPTAQAATPLEKQGWTLVTSSEQTLVYMKPATVTAEGLKRVWTAYDSDLKRRRGGFEFMSVQSLGEFDCQKRLSRVVAETFHEEKGLRGVEHPTPDMLPTDWAPAQPGSVGEIRMAFVCEGGLAER